MTKAKLMASLYDYRALCTRIDVLAYRVQRAESSFALCGAAGIAGAQLASKPVSDMPISHGGVQSPVERTALMLERVDGARREELMRDVRELEEMMEYKRRLDILLGGLLERERFVIMAHLVSGLKWRETGARYAQIYGDELTEGALKYIMRQGLERMVRAGEGLEE